MRTFGPAPEPLPEYHDNLVLASITAAPEFRAGLVNAAVTAATLAGLGEFAASLTALAPGLVALAAHGLPPAGPSGALATLNRLAEAGDIVEVTPVVGPQRVAAAAFGARTTGHPRSPRDVPFGGTERKERRSPDRHQHDPRAQRAIP
jgi:hypothetical protein